MRTQENERFGEMLKVQQKLAETEMSFKFLTQDHDHLKTLLEESKKLQNSLTDELHSFKAKVTALEDIIRDKDSHTSQF
jgi:septal ring factor EnvC (AmiA/AmiB activator)